MVYIEALILLTVIGFLLYKWSVFNYHVLRDRGVPHKKPIPLLGNVDISIFLGKSSFLKLTIDRYMNYKESKVYGAYIMRDAVFYVHDLELIKKVGVKEFDTFTDHKSTLAETDYDVLAKSLIALKGQKWRAMRNILSPAFTGSKMRLMAELINECVIESVNYISDEVQAATANEVEMEMKDFFTRFTNDAIASTAFGIRVNSFKDRSNEFYLIGKATTQFRGLTLIKAFLFGMIPKIMKALRVKILDEKNCNYFYRLVFDAMKYRKEHGIIRPDMIHLLMEAKQQFEANADNSESAHEKFTDDDLLAQCLLFFFAGFETVSTCLCFTAHELLENPEVQDRLYAEILCTENKLECKPLNYDTLMNMKYMDMVLSESLRKWPPAIATDRVCSTDYTLQDDEDNVVVKLKKDDHVLIPIIGIHRNPEYFPNPETFLARQIFRRK